MPTFEAQLRQDLRTYAVELRQLAYTLPEGSGRARSAWIVWSDARYCR